MEVEDVNGRAVERWQDPPSELSDPPFDLTDRRSDDGGVVAALFETGLDSGGSSSVHTKNACEKGDSHRPAVVMGCAKIVRVGMLIPWEWESFPPRFEFREVFGQGS